MKSKIFLFIGAVLIIIGLSLLVISIFGLLDVDIGTGVNGFILLLAGIIIVIVSLRYLKMKKQIEEHNNLSTYIYPISPKSVTNEHLKTIGTPRYELLKATCNTCRFSAKVAIIIGIVIDITVILALYLGEYEIWFIALMTVIWSVLAFTLFIIFIRYCRYTEKYYTEHTVEQFGQEILNKYFEQQKSNPNRLIDIPYYRECNELKSINFTPSVYARGGAFEAIDTVDVLLDEKGGKFAVCTSYDDTTLEPTNIFEMSKVLVVSLVNNGETIYETQNQDSVARAMLGYMVAGGVGAMVGASTATTNTVAKKKNDLNLVITYNDLGRAYLTFKFGKNKINAENLYQIFTVVCKRNQN